MKVIIIGGGISGVFAAIELCRLGHQVTILEKKDRILKKMLTTGNGRCNLTNKVIEAKCYNSNFVKEALDGFNNQNFIDYLLTLGISTTFEEDRVYPKTLKAQTVVNQLLEEIEELEIEVITSSPVLRVEKDNSFHVFTNENEYIADKVVFAIGGCSAPKTGSDGKSFEILKDLGHNITSLYPALTQINIDSTDLKAVSGVKVYSNVKLLIDGEIAQEDEGEVLFTSYGLSGPPILNLSKMVNLTTKKCIVQFSLINHADSDTKDELYNMYYTLGHYPLSRWLAGFIDKKLIHYISKKLNLDLNAPICQMDERNFDIMVNELLNHQLETSGTQGFDSSQVTVGGVELSEVDNKTFESKVIKGLYIIGEALDIDGICGGYNIQWAVSSAMEMSKNI